MSFWTFALRLRASSSARATVKRSWTTKPGPTRSSWFFLILNPVTVSTGNVFFKRFQNDLVYEDVATITISGAGFGSRTYMINGL